MWQQPRTEQIPLSLAKKAFWTLQMSCWTSSLLVQRLQAQLLTGACCTWSCIHQYRERYWKIPLATNKFSAHYKFLKRCKTNLTECQEKDACPSLQTGRIPHTRKQWFMKFSEWAILWIWLLVIIQVQIAELGKRESISSPKTLWYVCRMKILACSSQTWSFFFSYSQILAGFTETQNTFLTLLNLTLSATWTKKGNSCQVPKWFLLAWERGDAWESR